VEEVNEMERGKVRHRVDLGKMKPQFIHNGWSVICNKDLAVVIAKTLYNCLGDFGG
jgi:hypothetical protein